MGERQGGEGGRETGEKKERDSRRREMEDQVMTRALPSVL